MNSMLVAQFMDIEEKVLTNKQLWRITAILGGFGSLILVFGVTMRGLGSLMLVTALLFWIYKYAIKKWANAFQNNSLVRFESWYERQLGRAFKGRNMYYYVATTVVLLLASFVFFGISVGMGRTKIEFFPDNRPNQIVVYIEYPQGTDIEKTNEMTLAIEKEVYAVLNDPTYLDGDYNYMLDSAVSQVGEGAGNPQTDGGSAAEMPHRGKITASLREYKYRRGQDSELLRLKVQEALHGLFPGVAISVEKDANGPPVGYPINIELEGPDYDELIQTAERMRAFLNTRNIDGVEELKIDVNKGNPSMTVAVDREKAGALGIAVGQVGMQLRRSLFGEKAGVYKENGEDYDINVRFNESLKHNPSALFDQNIVFRDPANGQIKEVPISAVAQRKNTTGFSAVKHRDNKRVVTVYSGLKPGFSDAQAVVNSIQKEMLSFDDLPKQIRIDYTGQIEEQNKQMQFLMGAFFSGLGLIMFLLIFQFSGISKPLIIMIAIFLSFVGVFGGLILTGWSFVIMMTMMGIIALAGIVVNNGVVLLDYAQLLIDRYKVAKEIEDKMLLPKEILIPIIVAAGKARLRPVILTAITTVLGLIPLAIGLNINFISLFTTGDPQVYIGGDNVIFWGPLAWTVIFGLTVATFLTLIIVPVLLYMTYRIKWGLFAARRYTQG